MLDLLDTLDAAINKAQGAQDAAGAELVASTTINDMRVQFVRIVKKFYTFNADSPISGSTKALFETIAGLLRGILAPAHHVKNEVAVKQLLSLNADLNVLDWFRGACEPNTAKEEQS